MNRRRFIASCIGVVGAAVLAPLVRLGGEQYVYNVTDVTFTAPVSQAFDDLIVGVKRQSALMLDNLEVTLENGQRILAMHGIDPRPYWEEVPRPKSVSVGELMEWGT